MLMQEKIEDFIPQITRKLNRFTPILSLRSLRWRELASSNLR